VQENATMRIKLDNVTGSLARAKQLEEGSGDSLKSQQQLVVLTIMQYPFVSFFSFYNHPHTHMHH
jgi:hypothetical protein